MNGSMKAPLGIAHAELKYIGKEGVTEGGKRRLKWRGICKD